MVFMKHEEIKQAVTYIPETGELFWKARPRSHFKHQWSMDLWNNRFSGKPAFATKTNKGYLKGAFNRIYHEAHRVIWFYMTGEWPVEVDHENGIRNDNRWVNLRSTNRRGNGTNLRLSVKNLSGYHGVYKVEKTNKWYARIATGNGKKLHLGTFENKEDAISARIEAERKFGYHENHGSVLT